MVTPMRLLMVTREAEAEKRYGIGRSLQPLVDELQARGHEVRYLCRADLRPRGERRFARLNALMCAIVRRLPVAGGQIGATVVSVLLERLNMGRLAAKLAKREGYSHVHCHDPFIAYGFWLFSRLWHFNRARWGVAEHGFGSYTQAIYEDGIALNTVWMRWLRRLEAAVLRRAHWVTAPTAVGLNQLARDLAVCPVPSHWHVVRHAKPKLNRYDRAQARMRLGWDEVSFYVLGVGRIVPLKQFPVLLQACADVDAPKPIQLVILGEGDSKSLRQQAVALGIAPPVVDTTDDVGLYLSAADLYVSASSTEAFGMANLEALTAGVPAICSAVGGVPEVVGGSAWLVAPEKSNLSAAIDLALNDEKFRDRLKQRGLAQMTSWPTIENIADNYEKLFRAPA